MSGRAEIAFSKTQNLPLRRCAGGTEGCDFDDLATKENVGESEPTTDQATITEQALDLFWQGVGRYVEILGGQPEHQIADAATD